MLLSHTQTAALQRGQGFRPDVNNGLGLDARAIREMNPKGHRLLRAGPAELIVGRARAKHANQSRLQYISEAHD